MTNDIIIVIGFIVVVIGLCKCWNWYAMNKYKKQKANRLNIVYNLTKSNQNKIKIEGIGIDKNGDYAVSQAIKKIKMLDSTRIR